MYEAVFYKSSALITPCIDPWIMSGMKAIRIMNMQELVSSSTAGSCVNTLTINLWPK